MGNQVRVRLTWRVVRLLLLLGVAVAAYLVLSLFDHAAHADAGSIDQSIKAVADGAGKAVPEPKSILPEPKSILPEPKSILPEKAQTIKVPAVRPRKVHAARKIQALSIRARAAVTPARKAVVRLPSLPELPEPAKLPGLPQARTPASIPTTALPGVPAPRQPLMPPVSAQVSPPPQAPAFAPAPGLSGVTKPPAPGLAGVTKPPAPGLSGVTKPPKASARSQTAPLPAPPGLPADRSTPTGQARDSGGGDAPAMGAVPSSWRPEVTAAGRRLPADLIARGRTVRYAGPPS